MGAGSAHCSNELTVRSVNSGNKSGATVGPQAACAAAPNPPRLCRPAGRDTAGPLRPDAADSAGLGAHSGLNPQPEPPRESEHDVGRGALGAGRPQRSGRAGSHESRAQAQRGASASNVRFKRLARRQLT